MRSLYYLMTCMFASMAVAVLHHDHVHDLHHGKESNLHPGDDHQHHSASLPKPPKRFGGLESETSPRRKKSSPASLRRTSGRRTSANPSRVGSKQSQTTSRTKKSSSRTGSRAGSRTSSRIGSDPGDLIEQHHPSSYLSHSPSLPDLHHESKGSSPFHRLIDPLLSSNLANIHSQPRPIHRGRKPVHPKSYSKDRGITALTDASAFY